MKKQKQEIRKKKTLYKEIYFFLTFKFNAEEIFSWHLSLKYQVQIVTYNNYIFGKTLLHHILNSDIWLLLKLRVFTQTLTSIDIKTGFQTST